MFISGMGIEVLGAGHNVYIRNGNRSIRSWTLARSVIISHYFFSFAAGNLQSGWKSFFLT